MTALAKHDAAREAIRKRACENAYKGQFDAISWADAAAQLLVEAQAELDEARAQVADDTGSRLRGMHAAFTAAHEHSAGCAITDDDPGPALANARAWKSAADAVAGLL